MAANQSREIIYSIQPYKVKPKRLSAGRPLLIPDDDWILSQLVNLYLAQDKLIDITPQVAALDRQRLKESPNAFTPILNNDLFPRTNQFISDVHRMGLLRSITCKALMPSRAPSLPLELVHRVVDILRGEWLAIPYAFTAPSLKLVWDQTVGQVQWTGGFDGFTEVRLGFFSKAVVFPVEPSQQKYWNKQVHRWCCSCSQGVSGTLLWDQGKRRWRCGEDHTRDMSAMAHKLGLRGEGFPGL